MTTIYINGKKTPKEELKNIEIRNEGVKRIIRDALYRREKGISALPPGLSQSLCKPPN